MKIKFGTSLDNVVRAEFLSVVLMCCTGLYFEIWHRLDNAHEAVRKQMANATSLDNDSFCGIPYEDCLCSVQSLKNEQLKHCLTENFLLASRMFPLVSFVLQIFLIRDLFSVDGKYSRFIVYGLWFVSVFILIITTNGIYRSSCFHCYINLVSCETDIILFFLMFCDLAHNYGNNSRSPSDCNPVDDQILERTHNDASSWRELL